MNRSMNISKTAIKAQQYSLSSISNNIANATTDGYKAKDVRFQTLAVNDVTGANRLLGDEFTLSAGVRAEVSGANHQGGSIRLGPNPFDLSIQGDGFFGVQNGNGDFYLTKDGAFSLDAAGQLVNANGDYLVGEGQTPLVLDSGQEFSIAADGTIYGYLNGETTELGTIPAYLPNNIQSLQPAGNNYFTVPDNQINQIENMNGIEVRSLEMSNVDLSKEITDLIIAQRAYALNIKVAQSTDELKTMTNQFS